MATADSTSLLKRGAYGGHPFHLRHSHLFCPVCEGRAIVHKGSDAPWNERHSRSHRFWCSFCRCRFQVYRNCKVFHYRASPVRFTREDIAWAFALNDGLCVYCRGKAQTADHVIPPKMCGLSIRSNIAAACNRCNSSKRACDVKEWVVKKFGAEGLARFEAYSAKLAEACQ